MKQFLLSVFLLVASAAGLQAQQAPAGGDTIRWQHRPQSPEDNAQLFLEQKSLPALQGFAGHRFLALQFERPLSQEERNKLGQAGIQTMGYLPARAYLAAIGPSAEFSALGKLPLRAALPIPDSAKLAPALRDTAPFPDYAQTNNRWRLSLKSFPPLPRNAVRQALQDSGIAVQTTEADHQPFWQISVSPDRVAEIASWPFVQYLEPDASALQATNHKARSSTGAAFLQQGQEGIPGLSGQGVTYLLGDEGAATHPDFQHRLTDYSQSPPQAHTAHLAGTLAGAGLLNERHKGMAPAAKLVTTHRTQALDSNLAYQEKASLVVNGYTQSNNPTTGLNSLYNSNSHWADAAFAGDQAALSLFPAGNAGQQSPPAYPEGFGTIPSGFAASKNALIVGALGQAKQHELAAFSSRGPTQDGRLKPDLCAPGEALHSTKNGEGYQNMSGTSMATAVVAGGMGLLVERFHALFPGKKPHPALLKALALNTARDFGPRGPDFGFGFGSFNAQQAVEALNQGHYWQNSLRASETQTYAIEVPAEATQLKVLLHWQDKPGMPLSAKALVNDLELRLLSPSGDTLLPWAPSAHPDSLGLGAQPQADHRNNTEQVVIENPEPGTYQALVKGHLIPLGPQHYALTYAAPKPSLSLSAPAGGQAHQPYSTLRIAWQNQGLQAQSYKVEISHDNGASWSLVANNIPADQEHLQTTPTQTAERAKIRVTALPSGLSATSQAFTLMHKPLFFQANTLCRGVVELNWNQTSGAESYEVLLLDSTIRTLAQTSNNTYRIKGLNPEKTYWFAVRALLNNRQAGPRTAARKAQPSSGLCPWEKDAALKANGPKTSVRRWGTPEAFSAAEPLSLKIWNGGQKTLQDVPLHLQVNDQAPTQEVLAGPLAPGDSATYTFSAQVDLSKPGQHRLRVWAAVPNDGQPGNDTLSLLRHHLPNPPVKLPLNEDFEQAAFRQVTEAQKGLPGLTAWDYSSSNGLGRLRSQAGSAFPAKGEKALTLDATKAQTTTNSLTATYNLSAYDTTQPLMLSFDFRHHGEENQQTEGLSIRGSSQEAWISLPLQWAEAAAAGKLQHAGPFNLSQFLRQNEQNFSAHFQIRIRQSGNGSAQSLTEAEGITVDQLRLFRQASLLNLATTRLQLLEDQPTASQGCRAFREIPVAIQPEKPVNDTLWARLLKVSGSADSLLDYALQPDALAFYPGDSTAKQIQLQIFDDHAPEQNDSLRLKLAVAGKAAAAGGDSLLKISIRDNDTSPESPGPPLLAGQPHKPGWEIAGKNLSPVGDTWVFAGQPAVENFSQTLTSPQIEVSRQDSLLLDYRLTFANRNNQHLVHAAIEYRWENDKANWQVLETWNNATIEAGKSRTIHRRKQRLPLEQSGSLRIRFRFFGKGSSASVEQIGLSQVALYQSEEPAPTFRSKKGQWQAFLGPHATAYYYDDQGRPIATIENLSAHNFGCTELAIDRSGNSAQPFSSEGKERFFVTDKTFYVEPTRNHPEAPYRITFFFTEAEIAGWEARTGNHRSSMSLVKSPAPIAAQQPRRARTALEAENSQFYGGFALSGKFNSGFSGFAGVLPSTPLPLPLELAWLRAQPTEQTVKIRWATLREDNLQYFVVEAADSEEDLLAGNFREVGTRLPQNAANGASYEMTDTHSFSQPLRYYRLKILEKDSSLKFTHVITVRKGQGQDLSILRVWPNPVADRLTVQWNQAEVEVRRVEIWSRHGKKISNAKLSHTQNGHLLQVRLQSDLTRGLYFMRVLTDQGPQDFRFIKD